MDFRDTIFSDRPRLQIMDQTWGDKKHAGFHNYGHTAIASPGRKVIRVESLHPHIKRPLPPNLKT